MPAPARAESRTSEEREAFNEALADDGSPRPHYRDLLDGLVGLDLRAVAASAQNHVDRAGITFKSEGKVHSFRIDAVPRLIGSDEWERLAAGMSQRARALESFIADAYGPRRMVGAGRIPECVIDTADHFEPAMRGVEASGGWAAIAGFDLVRNARGELRVLEDNLRTPSGFTYATAARAAVSEALPEMRTAATLDPRGSYPMMGAALAAAGTAAALPQRVILSEGRSSAAFFEHRELAQELGIPFVGPRDLSVRRGRLVARVPDGGLREVGVLLRRSDEDRLVDEAGEPTWLAEVLLEPIREGTLAVVNAFGTGVADDKLAHAYVEEMVRFFLDEEPLLRSVPTFDLDDPAARAEVLERLDEMVVKPRSGSGGHGIIVCPHAQPDDFARAAQLVRDHPADWIAQECVTLSTHPTICDRRLEPRHVDLRAFTIHGDAAPAALTRYALDRGALVVNSSQGGGGKDTWVLGDPAGPTRRR